MRYSPWSLEKTKKRTWTQNATCEKDLNLIHSRKYSLPHRPPEPWVKKRNIYCWSHQTFHYCYTALPKQQLIKWSTIFKFLQHCYTILRLNKNQEKLTATNKSISQGDTDMALNYYLKKNSSGFYNYYWHSTELKCTLIVYPSNTNI